MGFDLQVQEILNEVYDATNKQLKISIREITVNDADPGIIINQQGAGAIVQFKLDGTIVFQVDNNGDTIVGDQKFKNDCRFTEIGQGIALLSADGAVLAAWNVPLWYMNLWAPWELLRRIWHRLWKRRR